MRKDSRYKKETPKRKRTQKRERIVGAYSGSRTNVHSAGFQRRSYSTREREGGGGEGERESNYFVASDLWEFYRQRIENYGRQRMAEYFIRFYFITCLSFIRWDHTKFLQILINCDTNE